MGVVTWYVQDGNAEPTGPLTTDTLLDGVRQGRVPIAARVCEVGAKEWTPLAIHPTFASVVREVAPPPGVVPDSPPAATSRPKESPPTLDLIVLGLLAVVGLALARLSRRRRKELIAHLGSQPNSYRAAFLIEAIQSVTAKTFEDWEAIVVGEP